jgi:hypothetical protein
MTREQIEHAIRAACEVSEDTEICIGSQAILAEFPDAPKELRASIEADYLPIEKKKQLPVPGSQNLNIKCALSR